MDPSAAAIYPNEDNFVMLPSGRRLGYAEYGDPDGRPLIFLHGTPSSRVMFRLGDRAAREAGVRLIAPDRPGLGLSDPHSNRTIPDFADDVASLADHLSLGRFPLAGLSGGGPYAAACGVRLGDRLTALGLVSAMAPVASPAIRKHLTARYSVIYGIGRRSRLMTALGTKLFRRAFAGNPDRVMRFAMSAMTGPDREILADDRTRGCLIASAEDAFSQGTSGPVTELALMSRAWGFEPSDIPVPTFLWHGEADTVVPAAFGRWLAERIPDCRARFIPGAGHFWIAANGAEVLGTLTAGASSESGPEPRPAA